MSMYDEEVRNRFDLKIFINCDADVALARRIKRDISERGRDVNEVLQRYNRFVKKDFEKFVQPQMKYVDLIIPGGAKNDLARKILVNTIKQFLKGEKLKSRRMSVIRSYNDTILNDLKPHDNDFSESLLQNLTE